MTDKKITTNGFITTRTPSGEDPEAEQVALCVEWIAEFADYSKAWMTRHSSYGHKHRVERWTARHGSRQYISNGAFIVAASQLGYELKRERANSPNAVLKMRLKRGWQEYG